MRWMLVFFTSLILPQALAASLKTSIFSIEESGLLDVMVKTERGEVLWLSPQHESTLQLLKQAAREKVFVQLEIDVNHFILNARRLNEKIYLEESELEFDSDKLQYTPTVFSSLESLKAAFLTMRRDSQRRSQCYERAYVWGYDLWETQEINSMKLFLFFTNKYIREYRYKWWYHVSPMSYVGEQEYVLDRLFTKRPLIPKTWTNIFMKNNALCKSVESYFEYSKDDPNEYCFLIRSTMFYLGPTALKLRDQGVERTIWNTRTLQTSRRRGFY